MLSLTIINVKKILVKLQNFLVLTVLKIIFLDSDLSKQLSKIGSDYGGWWISNSILKEKMQSRVALSAGLGFDVSFDKGLLDAGFVVIGIDPLEKSIHYARGVLKEYSTSILINAGLWNESGKVNFYAPKNKLHDSWSAKNIQNTPISQAKQFSVISLQEVIKQNPIINSSDYFMIKMDIEGAEIELLHEVCNQNIKCDLLAAELDCLSLIKFIDLYSRLKTLIKVVNLCTRLKNQGYKLAKIDGFNFHWLSH
jgi:FkbM family methyltransferase